MSDQLLSLGESGKEWWREIVSNIGVTHNSNNPQPSTTGITPNQVAKQLSMNGKPLNRERGYIRRMKEKMIRTMNICDDIFLLSERGVIKHQNG